MGHRSRAGHPTLRAALSVGLLSTWLVLLMAGWAWGGAVHLLLVASLALFPWGSLRGVAAPAVRGRTSDRPCPETGPDAAPGPPAGAPSEPQENRP